MKLHCKFCGSNTLTADNLYHLHCGNCKKINFQNPVSAAGCFLIDEAGNIGLAQRAFDPRKGKYDEAGGFCDLSDQSLEDTIMRELQEELHLSLEKEQLHYLASSFCEYPFDGYVSYVMTSYFYAHITPQQKESITSNDDVKSFEWFSKETFDRTMMCSEFQAELVMKVFTNHAS